MNITRLAWAMTCPSTGRDGILWRLKIVVIISMCSRGITSSGAEESADQQVSESTTQGRFIGHVPFRGVDAGSFLQIGGSSRGGGMIIGNRVGSRRTSTIELVRKQVLLGKNSELTLSCWTGDSR